MNDASLALQTAVRGLLIVSPALTALVPVANILDHSGPASRFPSIMIGEGQTIQEKELQTYERDLWRVYLDCHIWAKSDDLAPVKMMAGAIRDVLRNAAPWNITDYRVVDLTWPMTRFMRDREGDTPLAHGVVTIAALLQEAAFT